jgi:hypothetical protein
MFRYIFEFLNMVADDIIKAASNRQPPTPERPPSVHPMESSAAPSVHPQNSTGAPSVCPQAPPTGFSDLPHTAATAVPAAGPVCLTDIAAEAFMDRTDLTEFTVPEGVRTIGFNAFRGCSNLQKITLPESLEEIGNGAFENCAALAEIRIPDGVRKIGNHAFSKCSLLRSFRFPKGMTGKRIEVGMFYDCTSLKTVELPERLSGEFTNVFSHCKCLRSITLPEGISELGSFTFQDCGLIQEVKIPSTVSVIQYKAFISSGLREIFIPDNVKIIDVYQTFAYCQELERIRLPIGVHFRKVFHDADEKDGIGACFSHCPNLKTVYLGTRQFELEGKLDEDSMLLMYAELAAEGDITAFEIVRKDKERAMQLLDAVKNEQTKKMLMRYGI